MKTSNTKAKVKALLQACLSKPATLCKTRREVVFETAKELGFDEKDAMELAQRTITLWTAMDILLEQYVENYSATI